ncbi:MAG: helix-turn-helix transcriptional regulator [Pseudomonadota bacterium]
MRTIDKHLGMRIAQARSDSGVSLDEVAAALEVSVAEYAALERGEQRVSAFVLANISRLFGRSISWFYEGLPGQSVFKRGAKPSSV